MTNTFKLVIPGDPAYIDMAKMSVATVASIHKFNVDDVEDIKISVAEACKSITCHGHDGWSDSYEIECILDENKITITIADPCCSYRLHKGKKPCMDCPREGDLGVNIIKSLMEDVEIIKNGESCTSIKMVKKIC